MKRLSSLILLFVILGGGYNTIFSQEKRGSKFSRIRSVINTPATVLLAGPASTLTWDLETRVIEADLGRANRDTLILENIHLLNDMEHRGEIERALRGSLDEVVLMLPTVSVEELEISRGRKSNVRKGALIGAVIGAGIGGSRAISPTSNSGRDLDAELYYVSWIIFYGALGAGVGAVVGAIIKTERWDEISIQQIAEQPGVRTRQASTQ
jgi:hypothetical protein